MKDMLSFKGYYGSVHYNRNDRTFYGKIEFIRSLVSYEGNDVDSLESGFVAAVEDYLATCAEIGKAPEKPFKGSFNVRIPPELHERVAIAAAQHGVSLNRFVADTLNQVVYEH